jgi:hypothetical protein
MRVQNYSGDQMGVSSSMYGVVQETAGKTWLPKTRHGLFDENPRISDVGTSAFLIWCDAFSFT